MNFPSTKKNVYLISKNFCKRRPRDVPKSNSSSTAPLLHSAAAAAAAVADTAQAFLNRSPADCFWYTRCSSYSTEVQGSLLPLLQQQKVHRNPDACKSTSIKKCAWKWRDIYICIHSVYISRRMCVDRSSRPLLITAATFFLLGVICFAIWGCESIYLLLSRTHQSSKYFKNRR